MLQICLSLLSTVEEYNDQLESFASNKGEDVSEKVVTKNIDNLADEYHFVEHKRKPDHVFLRFGRR